MDKYTIHILQTEARDRGDLREVVRLAALGLPKAGAFMGAVPNPATSMKLQTQEFVLSMCYRLGLPIYPEGVTCYKWDAYLDMYGDHAMHCGHGPERIQHHIAWRDCLATAARGAQITTRVEAMKIIEENTRPGDVLLQGYLGGNNTAINVSVVSPFQEAYLRAEADEPGVAIKRREEENRARHEASCRREGIGFMPMAAHTIGGMSLATVKEIGKIAGAMARAHGDKDSMVIGHTFQGMSLAIQRGNASMLVTRLTTVDQQVDGNQEEG